MKIHKSIFRYIEYELYNYEDIKKELNSYKEEITESTATPETHVKGGISNITENKAIKLTTSVFIVRAERTIKAIEKALGLLEEKHRDLFKLKYIEILPWQVICMELDISDRSYFRLRREVVITVGQQMGLLNL